MTLYSFHLLRSSERTIRPVLDQITAGNHALVDPARPWGLFVGLFGIASNEVAVVLSGDREELESAGTRLGALPGVAMAMSYVFEPTVRPTDPTPLTRAGLYVLRFFDVDNDDVEEVARLSSEAWPSFVNPNGYQAEPQALFCEVDRMARQGKMLLVTWYDGFESWQASRTPASEAQERFQRRRALTASTVAFATRLVID